MSRKALISISQAILTSPKTIVVLSIQTVITQKIFSAFSLLLNHSKPENYAIICSIWGNDKTKLLHSAHFPSSGRLPMNPHRECRLQI